MRAERILRRGRVMAESLMQSTVRIQRKAGEPVRSPATGKMEQAWTLVYEGPCRTRFQSSVPRAADQAGQRFSEQAPTVWVPAHVSDVRVDDVGEILTNPHAPGDAGLQFRVQGIHAQTHSTSRRLPVEVLSYARD